ncbi:MAG: hypothetical protein R2865_14420 [Deinococcales bacterium]
MHYHEIIIVASFTGSYPSSCGGVSIALLNLLEIANPIEEVADALVARVAPRC